MIHQNTSTIPALSKIYLKLIGFWMSIQYHSITGLRASDRHHPPPFKPLSKVNLDDVFCFKDIRIVKKDNTFSYQGRTYQITNQIYPFSWNKAKIILYILHEKRIRAFHQEKFIQGSRMKLIKRALC